MTVMDTEAEGRSTHFRTDLSQERARQSTSRELRKSPSALRPPGRDDEARDCPGWLGPWGSAGLVPHLQMGRLRPETKEIFPGPHVSLNSGRQDRAEPVKGKDGRGTSPEWSLQGCFSPPHPPFSLPLLQ